MNIRSIVTVGGGRGFIVQGPRDRVIITAAHCLPNLPPAISFSAAYERTYPAILSALGAEPSISAECLFVDPVADLAILGAVDGQEDFEGAALFDELAEATSPIGLGVAQKDQIGWMVSLAGTMVQCRVQHFGGPLWLSEATAAIMAGMSGSPIVDANGLAIGVVCTGAGGMGAAGHTKGGPHPRLDYHLPLWLAPLFAP